MIFAKGGTTNLLSNIDQAKDVQALIEVAKKVPTSGQFSEYLEIIIEETGMKKSELFIKADIERVYGYEILRGKKKPGRNIALRLLIGSEIEFDDVQHVLKNSGYPILYPKNIRDSVIVFGIKKQLGLLKINETLFNLGYEAL